MDDILWLRKLQEDIWPRGVILVRNGVARTLTKEELERVLSHIEGHKLIAEMICSNMFGGYGMRLYEHEPYPCTGAQLLITLVEDNLPVPTRYDHLIGEVAPKPARKPGCGRQDAWDLFSKYTHSAQNQEWIAKYKLQASREQSHYDY